MKTVRYDHSYHPHQIVTQQEIIEVDDDVISDSIDLLAQLDKSLEDDPELAPMVQQAIKLLDPIVLTVGIKEENEIMNTTSRKNQEFILSEIAEFSKPVYGTNGKQKYMIRKDADDMLDYMDDLLHDYLYSEEINISTIKYYTDIVLDDQEIRVYAVTKEFFEKVDKINESLHYMKDINLLSIARLPQNYEKFMQNISNYFTSTSESRFKEVVKMEFNLTDYTKPI